MPIKSEQIKIDAWLKKNNLTRKDVKRHLAEFYPNGQVKMYIEYVGSYWDAPDVVQLDWIEYDDEGKLMHFENKDDRLEWFNGMWHKYMDIIRESEESYKLWKARFEEIFPEHPNQDIDTNKKDFPTLWQCALYVKILVSTGALNISANKGFRWACKHCTIQGEDIDDWKKLKKNYDNAVARNENRVVAFEMGDSAVLKK